MGFHDGYGPAVPCFRPARNGLPFVQSSLLQAARAGTAMRELKGKFGIQLAETDRDTAAMRKMKDGPRYHGSRPKFPAEGPDSVDKAAFRYR